MTGLSGSVELRAVQLPPLPPFGGNPLTISNVPWQSGASPTVHVICRFRLLALLVVVCLAGCRSQGPSLQERQRLAEQQRLTALCERLQPRLPALLRRFAAAQQALADVRERRFPATAPPEPLDPDEQRRLTIYDQQTEQDLYEQAVAVWERKEAERRDVWQADQRRRENAATESLKAAAAALQQLHPELVQLGEPPRLNETELVRLRVCRLEQLQ